MSSRKPRAAAMPRIALVKGSATKEFQQADEGDKMATLSSVQLVSVNSARKKNEAPRPKRQVKATKRLIEDEEEEEPPKLEREVIIPTKKVTKIVVKRAKVEEHVESEEENHAPEEEEEKRDEDETEDYEPETPERKTDLMKNGGEKPRDLVPCQVCGKLVLRKNMTAHTYTHSKIKELYCCTECEKTFTKLYSLKRHMLQGHGVKDGSKDSPAAKKESETVETEGDDNVEDKACQCSYCDKQFLGIYWLEKHMRSNHKEEYEADNRDAIFTECEICEKVIRKKYLNEHMRTHSTDKKRYMCLICDKDFWKSYSLKRHMQSVHPDDIAEPAKAVNCDICGKIYTHPSSLHYHKLGHSEKKHTCELCGEKFRTNSALKKHVVIHTRPKEHKKRTKATDAKAAASAERLMAAARKKRMGGIECKVCGGIFEDLDNLAMHLEMHTPEQFALAQEAKEHDGPASDGESEIADEPMAANMGTDMDDDDDDELDIEESTMYCGHCDKEFTDIKEMSAHFVKFHEESLSDKTGECLNSDVEKATAVREGGDGDGSDKIICAICDASLDGLKEMKTHMVETHPEEMSTATRLQLVKDTKRAPATIPERLSAGDLLIENLSCARCEETFTFLADLNTHIFDVHLDELTPHEMEAVRPKPTEPKTKPRIDSFKKPTPRVIFCGHCEESFSKIHEMNTHIVEKHAELISPDVLAALKTCNPREEDVMIGNRRKRVVDPKRRPGKAIKEGDSAAYVTCQHCDISVRRDGMKQHLDRVHLKISKAHCDICDKKFYDKNSLRRHNTAVHRMQLKLDEPCFKCQMCEATYASRSSLHSHIQSKHNPVTYSCWCCGREFRELSILNKHMLLHDDKAVRCRLCRFVYKDWARLEQHVRRVHPDIEFTAVEEIGFLNTSTEPVSVAPRHKNRERERGETYGTMPRGALADLVLPLQTEIKLDGSEEIVDDGSIMVVEVNDEVLTTGEFAILEDQASQAEGPDGEVPDVYLCQICNAGFHDSNALIAHCVTVHPDTLRIVFEEGTA